ncbi:protein kinase [candidate division KSB1 bacterium]|nr:protein kinase [candidate division KSB1 bacterium]
MIGQTISHYKILDKLGEGGMGVVYKAQDTKLDRVVALKFLPPNLTTNETDKARFIQEAKAAAAINHPNVCTIYDIQEHEGQQFIVMEYVEGQTLRAIVGTQHAVSLPMQDAIDYATQIAEALKVAHEKGIVHRDIKSENIMITSTGQVKVMDFGLAKLRGAAKLTKTTSTAGTLAYSSPEQIQGQDVDARSDIFSFGVVLYELLAGQLPFKGEYESATMYSVLNEEPEPIQKICPDISSECLHVLNRALEKDPEERYQSVYEMLIDLKRLRKVKRKGDEAGSLIPERSGKNVAHRRKKGIIPIATLLVIIVIIVSLVTFMLKGKRLIENRVVVANFENKTEDTSFDYLEQQIAENLTQEIGQLNFVEVVPLVQREELAESLSGTERMAEMSRRTRAGIVVSGTIYKRDDQLLFQPQITDMIAKRLLKALPGYEGPYDNPQIGIHEMNQRVLCVFALKYFTTLPDAIDFIGYVPRYRSFQEFGEGWEFFQKFDYRRAIERFETAFEYDPNFASASIDMTNAFINLNDFAKADSIIQTLGNTRESLSMYERKMLLWQEALVSGNRRQALQLNRELSELNSDFYYPTGLAAYRVNRLNEAKEWFSRVDTDRGFIKHYENYWLISGYVEYLLGNYEEYLELAQDRRKRFPDSRDALYMEMGARIALGQIDRVRENVNDIYVLSSDWLTPGECLLETAWILKAHGYEGEAAEFTGMALDWYRSRPESEQDSSAMKRQIFDALDFSVFHLSEELYPKIPADESQKIIIRLGREERIAMMREIIGELLTDESESMVNRGRYGVLMAKLGEIEMAMDVYDWLGNLKQPYMHGKNIMWQAEIAANLDEKERAVSLIHDAFQKGYSNIVHFHWGPNLKPLRDYPAFQEFIRPR